MPRRLAAAILILDIAVAATGCADLYKTANNSAVISCYAPQTQPAEPQPLYFTMVLNEAPAIVYLLDSSESMADDFDLIKAELVRAIDELNSNYEFSIITFSEKPVEMTLHGRPGLVKATAENLSAARAWLHGSASRGRNDKSATEDAIRRAFELVRSTSGLTPRIYLISNGSLEGEPDKLVAHLKKASRARLHTVSSTDRMPEGERLMKSIAAEGGGTYKLIGKDDPSQ